MAKSCVVRGLWMRVLLHCELLPFCCVLLSQEDDIELNAWLLTSVMSQLKDR